MAARKSKMKDLCRLLEERLASGVYPVGSRFPSEYMLADEFGINKKTANKATDQLVAAGMLQRAQGGAGTIVVKKEVFPVGQIAFLSNYGEYQMRILCGIQRQAVEQRYAVSVFFVESLDCRQLLDQLCGSFIQGIIFSSRAGNFAGECKLPYVAVDHDAKLVSDDCNVVNTDNLVGGRLIMDEVLRRGHREVVVYSSSRYIEDRAKRVFGMLESMRKWNIQEPQKRIFYGSIYDDSEAVNVLKKILRQFPDATVIVCDADDAARSMIRAAKLMQIRLPDKLTVTSYGNSMTGTEQLCTVEQFPERIGRSAFEILLRNLQNPNGHAAEKELICPKVMNPELIPDLHENA